MKDSAATPWKYEKFSSLMASVRSDLPKLDGIMDDDNYIKVIASCNEKLGERVHKSKQCKLIVKNYSAPIPPDLWKIENMLAIINTHHNINHLEGIFMSPRHYHIEENEELIPDKNEQIIYLCPTKNECCEQVKHAITNRMGVEQHFGKAVKPLKFTNKALNNCTDYSPCRQWNGEFGVDLNEDKFSFSFASGEVFLEYLGDLTDEEGELLYPFHPMLNDYYEYAVKEKILEDAFINSDMDVINKLQYVQTKKRGAYYDAFSFMQSAKANQWSIMKKKNQLEYYKKWYKAFDL